MRIAVIEDEKTTQIYIKDLLKAQGYDVELFDHGSKFLTQLKSSFYNLIILDINLPDINGFDVCYFIKKNIELYKNPKIIMLTERKGQIDVNKGLQLGADDYIKKPFDETEFILRINKFIKKEKKTSFKRFNYKNVIFDFEEFYVVEDFKQIPITKKEKEILEYFIINMGIILSKDKLYNEIWKEDFKLGNKNLEVYIGKLKKKVKIIKENLITIKNIGYKLKY